jgi:hypothetical protein
LLVAFGGIVAALVKLSLVALQRAREPWIPILPAARPFSWSNFLMFALPLLAWWMLVNRGVYPASMSSDSVDQWAQASGAHGVSNRHPIFYVFTIKILRMIADTPASVVAFQATAIAGALGYGLSWLHRVGASRRILIAGVLFAAACPVHAFMVNMVWKDAPYAGTLLLLTVQATRITLEDKYAERRSAWIGLGLALAVTPLWRHNGVVVLAGMVLLVPLWGWRWRKRAFQTALAATTGFFVVQAALVWALNVAPGGRHFQKNLFSTVVAPVLQQDAPLAPEELTFLDGVQNIRRRWRGVPGEFSGVSSARERALDRIAPSRKLKVDAEMLANYRKLAMDLAFRYPTAVVAHRLRLWSYLIEPFGIGDDVMRVGRVGVTGKKRAKALGLKTAPKSPKMFDFVTAWVDASLTPGWKRVIWRHEPYLYALVLGLAVALRRYRSTALLGVTFPILLSTAGVLIGGTAQHARYGYPLLLASIFFVPLFVRLMRPPSQPGESEAGDDRDQQAAMSDTPPRSEAPAGA